MSKPNEPGPASNVAISQDSQADLGKAAGHAETTIYQAPYYPYEEYRLPGQYCVSFQPGYTLAEHFAFLGFEFEPTSQLNNRYYAALDDQAFNAIRCDPGVSFIEDDVFSEEKSGPISEGAAIIPKHTEPSVYQAPYYPAEECRVPGEYMVAFRPGHTLADHFAFLGFEFELTARLNEGYGAALDDQVFNAVRYDPGVRLIEDDTYGEMEDIACGEADD